MSWDTERLLRLLPREIWVIASQLAWADPQRFLSFDGNRSDFSELLRNPQKGTLKIKISPTFLKGAGIEGTRCFGNRSPFNLDPRLVSLCDHSLYYWACGFNNCMNNWKMFYLIDFVLFLRGLVLLH